MDAAQLRPLSVGEILDVAIKVYRERFGSLVRAVALVVGPIAVVTALIQVSAFPDVNQFDAFDPATDPATDVDLGDVWTFLAGLILAGLMSYLAAEVATAASFKIVSGAYLDNPPDWRDSLRFAVSKLRSLLWLSILMGVLLLLGVLACLIPGAYLWGAWAVAVPVLLLEDQRGRKALGRSRALVRGRWWPTFGTLLVATILAAVVQGVLSGVLVGVTVTGANDLAQAVAQAVATTVGSVLTTPFTAAVVTVLYFDLRVRKEGFDLELLAQRVGVEPPPPGARQDLLPPPPPPGAAEPPYWPPPPGWRPPDG